MAASNDACATREQFYTANIKYRKLKHKTTQMHLKYQNSLLIKPIKLPNINKIPNINK